jgi:hypothetical protein
MLIAHHSPQNGRSERFDFATKEAPPLIAPCVGSGWLGMGKNTDAGRLN